MKQRPNDALCRRSLDPGTLLRWMVLGLTLIWTPGTMAAKPHRITVVTVRSLPVAIPPEFAAITTQVVLDRMPALESQLADGLARQPESRRADLMVRRLTPARRTELRYLGQALTQLQSGALTYLPAIVLDDRAVWYGRSIRQAVTRYEHWQARKESS